MPIIRSMTHFMLEARGRDVPRSAAATRWIVAPALAILVAAGLPSVVVAATPASVGVGESLARVLAIASGLPPVVPLGAALLAVVALCAIAVAIRRRVTRQSDHPALRPPLVPHGVPAPDVERRLADAMDAGRPRRRRAVDVPGAPVWVRRLGAETLAPGSDDVEGHWLDPETPDR